jgi:hypothetical protein
MEIAIALYRAHGFVEVTAFDGIEGGDHGVAQFELFMELELDCAPRSAGRDRPTRGAGSAYSSWRIRNWATRRRHVGRGVPVRPVIAGGTAENVVASTSISSGKRRTRGVRVAGLSPGQDARTSMPTRPASSRMRRAWWGDETASHGCSPSSPVICPIVATV